MPRLGQGEVSLSAKDSWLGAGLRGTRIQRDHTDRVRPLPTQHINVETPLT